MERELVCIVCPKGCNMKITLADDGRVESVVGNTCKRGVAYAEDECTHPKRTVTTTVRCEGGEVAPVKTSTTVPKELVFEVMRVINSLRAPSDVKIGDVVVENILDTGADVVVTGRAEK